MSLLTVENYVSVTSGMKSLAPEWQPTEKNLKANGMLAMYLGNEHNLGLPEDYENREWFESLLSHAWLDTKLPVGSAERENMLLVQRAIGYEFANERLLLQAFTRRSFREKGCFRGADYEVLELAGDSILAAVMYRILLRQYGHDLHDSNQGKIFLCACDEGTLSGLKQKYTSKDYLAGRCTAMGFDRFIRYGEQDDRSKPDAKEDVMEAILGAVAMDSGWDMSVLEDVTEKLLDVHLAANPSDEKTDDFDLLNAWWQKRFGVRPDYVTRRSTEPGEAAYECELRISLRDLDAERDWSDWLKKEDDFLLNRWIQGNELVLRSRQGSRSNARSVCAREGIHFLKQAGLYMNLKDTGIRPNIEEAIGQLQILSQRGYVGIAEYSFTDYEDYWECTCRVNSFWDSMDAESKKAAKKLAAFAVLIQIMRSAGLDDPEWDRMLEEAALE